MLCRKSRSVPELVPSRKQTPASSAKIPAPLLAGLPQVASDRVRESSHSNRSCDHGPWQCRCGLMLNGGVTGWLSTAAHACAHPCAVFAAMPLIVLGNEIEDSWHEMLDHRGPHFPTVGLRQEGPETGFGGPQCHAMQGIRAIEPNRGASSPADACSTPFGEKGL